MPPAFLFELPVWLTGTNFLIGIFVFLLGIVGLMAALMVRGRQEVSTLQVDRATAAEGLVKTRDAEITALKLELADTNEELEGLTAEHRTLSGIKLVELFSFWGQKEECEANIADLERQVRVLKKRKDGDTI